MFTANGKANTAVADLKPGMKVTGMESGLANWQGTDVMVHEELNAEVVAKAGNSMMIRGSKGVEKYAWSAASDITIVKDGKVVDASPSTSAIGSRAWSSRRRPPQGGDGGAGCGAGHVGCGCGGGQEGGGRQGGCGCGGQEAGGG